MARREVVIREDDLDGSPADETINFTVGTDAYELDLSSKNAGKFRRALQPYVEVARLTRSQATSLTSTQPTAAPADPRAVRAWARANGYDISPRGRVPGNVVTAFREAGY